MNRKRPIIVFCGLPGTLKTFLATRLAGSLGYLYLPTRAIGELSKGLTIDALSNARKYRYSKLSEVANACLALDTDIIMDGGFPSNEDISNIISGWNSKNIVIINCIADLQTRIKRLEYRSKDLLDHEFESAAQILKAQNIDPKAHDSHKLHEQFHFNTVIEANTSTMQVTLYGRTDDPAVSNIKLVLQRHMDSFESNHVNVIETHFDDLANNYESSTEWRTDENLLDSLQIKDLEKSARILDIGTGTGLAGQEYVKHGYQVIGLDMSPKMLAKAANKLNFVLLGNMLKTPFLDSYFDVVIARQSLHYVDALRFFKEVRRILKPRGRIILSGAIVPNERIRTFWQEFKNATQPLRLSTYTERDIDTLMENNNFKILSHRPHSISRRESLESISRRSNMTENDMRFFLENLEKLSSEKFPELHFYFEEGTLHYTQFWTTTIAELSM